MNQFKQFIRWSKEGEELGQRPVATDKNNR